MPDILKHRIPVVYTISFCLMAAIATVWLNHLLPGFISSSASSVTVSEETTPISSQIKIHRLSGYNYIKPIMFVDTYKKTDRFAPLLQQVEAYISQKKQAAILNNASFYLRDIDNLEWTGYNEDETYFPGSLMKVPELISILRLEEEKPGTLNKQVFYSEPIYVNKDPEFVSKQLQPGKSYSIKELLRYMIQYSDNNATILLDQNLDQRIFNKALTDLELPLPAQGATNYPISPRSFSLFMRSIYNASYLTISHSEYAAELLSTSEFKEGFAKGFPPSVKMIHKFGEAGNIVEHQLHESGIVYVNNHPYVLTIMTKGKDLKQLSTVISDLSAIVYGQINTGG